MRVFGGFGAGTGAMLGLWWTLVGEPGRAFFEADGARVSARVVIRDAERFAHHLERAEEEAGGCSRAANEESQGGRNGY